LTGRAVEQSIETIRSVKAVYAGQVRQVDAQLGRIFDRLRSLGKWNDTVVVVTADHGEQLFDHWLLGKTGYFDQSAHVPLIVRLPEKPETEPRQAVPGRVVSALTESIDIVPTLLALTNLETPSNCQGRSLLPWCNGETPVDWRDEVHWQFDYGRVANGRLSRALKSTAPLSRLDVVRTDRLKYVHFAGLPPVLFDLQADPLETINRAEDGAARSLLEEGEKRWHAWRLIQGS
jgi:arylsulfatase A-like enzyme